MFARRRNDDLVPLAPNYVQTQGVFVVPRRPCHALHMAAGVRAGGGKLSMAGGQAGGGQTK